MRFTLAAAAAASILATAQARLTGITVPSEIKLGAIFNLTLETEDYIQSVQDVAVAFGCSPGKGTPESLGYFQKSFYIGPEKSNQLQDVKFEVILPDTFPKGNATCVATLMSLFGVFYMPVINTWNVTVTIGDETSAETVTSFDAY